MDSSDDLYSTDFPPLDQMLSLPEKEDAPVVAGPSSASKTPGKSSAGGAMAALTAAVASVAAEELAAESGDGKKPDIVKSDEDDKRDDGWTLLQKGKGKAMD
jgi:hypothetical protein